MKIIIPAVMVCYLLPGLAEESNHDGDVITYGAGAYSCASWTRDRNHIPTYIVNMQWVLGYVSAAGNCVDLKMADSNAMAGFMDKYCNEHPHSKMSDAAYELVNTLAP